MLEEGLIEAAHIITMVMCSAYCRSVTGTFVPENFRVRPTDELNIIRMQTDLIKEWEDAENNVWLPNSVVKSIQLLVSKFKIVYQTRKGMQ